MSNDKLLNIDELKELIKNGKSAGLLFCFGNSLVSKIIQAKTRIRDGEVVPSHVAMVYRTFIFESTTDSVHVNHKNIKSGVRMWLVSDYLKSEIGNNTKYYFYPTNKFDKDMMLKCLHLPYGKDSIVDFLIKDSSEGDRTHGLICSQYANKCTKLSKQRCPSPADLFRIVKDLNNGLVL